MKYVVALNMRRPVRFDHMAALLVGTLAVLGALLISLQMTHDHAANRASSQGSRLAEDLATRIAVTSQVAGGLLGLNQQALAVGIQGTARAIAGLQAGAAEDTIVGEANSAASQQLQAEILAMARSTTDDLDPYTKGLLDETAAELVAVLTGQSQEMPAADIQAGLVEQIRQIDISNAESDRSRVAVLGLTFAALGGVLVGLAVALKETRPGWGILILGWIVALLALGAAVLAGF